MPVLRDWGPSARTAWSRGAVAPSRVMSANAKGSSRGWPGTGSLTQVQVTTVPVVPTSTRSSGETAEWVTGSNSTGGTTTRPSDVRAARMRRSRRPVMNAPSTGPVERV